MTEQNPEKTNDEIIAELRSQMSNEQPRKTSRLRKFGCGILLVGWFLFIMTPCFLFMFISSGEFRLDHGSDIPVRTEYPLLRVNVISEVDYRGIQITNTTLHPSSVENNLCIQVDVRYVLWQGAGDPATYCDCYSRTDDDSDWQLSSTDSGVCP